MQELREKVAALDEGFRKFEEYEHERWHKLANDLQPLIILPTQMARDFGSLEGKIGHTIAEAVARALGPINEEISSLRADVEKLKLERSQLTGARMFAAWFLSTIIAIAAAIGWQHK